MNNSRKLQLDIDPRFRRQLPEDGPWIFWRDDDNGRRHGLLILPVAWLEDWDQDPADVCLIQLQGVVVGPDLRRVEIDRDAGTVELLWKSGKRTSALGKESLVADVNCQLGDASFPFSHQQRDPQLLSWLREELDGVVLDALHDLSCKLKGSSGPILCLPDSWSDDDFGQYVPWPEVHRQSRPDLYHCEFALGAGAREPVLESEEAYCVDPRCPCATLAVSFFEPWGGDCRLGSVFYDVAQDTIEKLDPIDGDEKDLLEAWSAYCGRYRDVNAHLGTRRDWMRAAAAAAADESKPGPEQDVWPILAQPAV